jgi:hypothetical protein
MPTKGLRRAIEHLQDTLTPDEELLQRFLSQRDEFAFAALVRCSQSTHRNGRLDGANHL